MLNYQNSSTFCHQFLAFRSPSTNFRANPSRPEVSHLRSVSWLRCSFDRMNETDLPCHCSTKGLVWTSKTEALSTSADPISSIWSNSTSSFSESRGNKSTASPVAFHRQTTPKLPPLGSFKTLLFAPSHVMLLSLFTITNLYSIDSSPLNSNLHTHPFSVQFIGTFFFHDPNSFVDPNITTCSPNLTWCLSRILSLTFPFPVLVPIFFSSSLPTNPFHYSELSITFF